MAAKYVFECDKFVFVELIMCECVRVCGPRSPPPLHMGVCVHRVSVLRGSEVNTEWSHTGNKLSDETPRNY